jgi:hypothetical protein
MNTGMPPEEHYELFGLRRELATVEDIPEAANRIGHVAHPSKREHNPSDLHAEW